MKVLLGLLAIVLATTHAKNVTKISSSKEEPRKVIETRPKHAESRSSLIYVPFRDDPEHPMNHESVHALDQQAQGSGYQTKGHKKGHKGGFKKHEAEKGKKGFEDHHGHKKKHYADHGKHHKSGHHDKGGKHHKGLKHHKKYHKDFHKGKKGKKGHHHSIKGHHDKGHKDKGFKNVYHKEEYGHNKKFYDDYDLKKHHKKYDHFDHHYKGHKGNKHKGMHHEGKKHHDEHEKKGSFHKGTKHEKKHGLKKKYGHKKHHNEHHAKKHKKDHHKEYKHKKHPHDAHGHHSIQYKEYIPNNQELEPQDLPPPRDQDYDYQKNHYVIEEREYYPPGRASVIVPKDDVDTDTRGHHSEQQHKYVPSDEDDHVANDNDDDHHHDEDHHSNNEEVEAEDNSDENNNYNSDDYHRADKEIKERLRDKTYDVGANKDLSFEELENISKDGSKRPYSYEKEEPEDNSRDSSKRHYANQDEETEDNSRDSSKRHYANQDKENEDNSWDGSEHRHSYRDEEPEENNRDGSERPHSYRDEEHEENNRDGSERPHSYRDEEHEENNRDGSERPHSYRDEEENNEKIPDESSPPEELIHEDHEDDRLPVELDDNTNEHLHEYSYPQIEENENNDEYDLPMTISESTIPEEFEENPVRYKSPKNKKYVHKKRTRPPFYPPPNKNFMNQPQYKALQKDFSTFRQYFEPEKKKSPAIPTYKKYFNKPKTYPVKKIKVIKEPYFKAQNSQNKDSFSYAWKPLSHKKKKMSQESAPVLMKSHKLEKHRPFTPSEEVTRKPITQLSQGSYNHQRNHHYKLEGRPRPRYTSPHPRHSQIHGQYSQPKHKFRTSTPKVDPIFNFSDKHYNNYESQPSKKRPRLESHHPGRHWHFQTRGHKPHRRYPRQNQSKSDHKPSIIIKISAV